MVINLLVYEIFLFLLTNYDTFNALINMSYLSRVSAVLFKTVRLSGRTSDDSKSESSISPPESTIFSMQLSPSLFNNHRPYLWIAYNITEVWFFSCCPPREGLIDGNMLPLSINEKPHAIISIREKLKPNCGPKLYIPERICFLNCKETYNHVLLNDA